MENTEKDKTQRFVLPRGYLKSEECERECTDPSVHRAPLLRSSCPIQVPGVTHMARSLISPSLYVLFIRQ